MNRMSRRCLIGILGGAIASIVLIATLHYSTVNLLLGVLVGAVYSAGIRPTRWAYVDNLMAGASLGIPLWGLISVIAVPIMAGQRPEWSAEEMRQHFPALVAWVVYGATLGIAIQAIARSCRAVLRSRTRVSGVAGFGEKSHRYFRWRIRGNAHGGVS